MNENLIKKGFDRYGRQRYLNKDTGKIFFFGEKHRKEYSQEIKDKAVALYIDGVAIRAVARNFEVSHVSILNWIKKAAIEMEATMNQEIAKQEYTLVELDEMWHFLKKKILSSGSGSL